MKSGFVLIAILALMIIGGAVGLVIYAGQMEAPTGPVEHVVPDDTLPQ